MTIRSQSLYKPLDDTPAGVNGPSVRIDHDRLRPTRKIKTHVIFKTTDRLSESEQEQMRDLFLRVFDKKMTKNTFDRKFFCTPRGYSHHSLMLREQTVVGAFSAVPGRYKHFGQELIFSLSVDTMIDSEHRDGVHLMTMANRLHQGLIRDGIPFIFGFPNELFYPVQKKLLKYTDIGELDYYVLPLNIGAVAKKLKPLSGISRAICRCATRLSRVP
ncbi:MAG: GNAT family N-acetyltransferase, partial [Planctomycetota bacterium]|nr:GNAT family N-acetyltransferase [Planctomycetota bacterium]